MSDWLPRVAAYSTRVTILRVLLRGKSPVPVVPGGRLTKLPRAAGHVEYGAKVYWAANSQSAKRNGLHEHNHMQQIPRRHAHTRWSQHPCIARASLQWCESAGAKQNCVLDEDKWTISWRLTLPSTYHREPEPMDTDASIIYLWVLLPTAHSFPFFPTQVFTPESLKAVRPRSRCGPK